MSELQCTNMYTKYAATKQRQECVDYDKGLVSLDFLAIMQVDLGCLEVDPRELQSR